MRCHKIEIRPNRHDTVRIDGFVRAEIVLFDGRHIDRLGNTRILIEFPQVIEEVRVIRNSPDVALEMCHVDRVKAHERCKQAPICFSQDITGKIPLL
jgi:hypothetical protein